MIERDCGQQLRDSFVPVIHGVRTQHFFLVVVYRRMKSSDPLALRVHWLSLSALQHDSADLCPGDRRHTVLNRIQ
jgi:hypothetical protein